MSLEMMNRVWKVALPTNDKLVLLALANHHNSDTGQCNPGQQLIASECSLSRKQIQNIIGRLSEKGLLKVDRRGFYSSGYKFNVSHELGYKRKPSGSNFKSVVANGSSHETNANGSSPSDANDSSHDVANGSSPTVANGSSHKPKGTVNKNRNKNPIAEKFPAEVVAIAERFAECRRIDAKMQKVTQQAISYYLDLLTGILKTGEVGITDLETLISWLETPTGMKSFAYGIGNMPKRSYEHALKRNLGSLLGKARNNTSTCPTDRDGFIRYDESKVTPVTEADLLDLEEVPF